MSTSLCNVFDCESCDHYSAARCPGCQEGNQQLEKRGIECCGVYKCVLEQGIESCSECSLDSCRLARADSLCPLRARFENRRWWAGRLARSLAESGKRAHHNQIERISDRTIDRLRWYLVALDAYTSQGIGSVSSWQLAQRVGVKAPLIRKDLSRFGEFGTPSFGYDVKYLRKKILDILHLNEPRHVAWLGAQKLREQLAVVQRIAQHNCQLVAVLDPDPSEVGKKVSNVPILHLDNLPQALQAYSIDLAVIALPHAEAQRSVNVLVRGGVTAVLNLTPSLLIVPEHVTVRNVDAAGEILALCYYCNPRRDKSKHKEHDHK